MTDFLKEKQREIDERLKELRPLVAEYERLEAAQTALSGVTNGTAPPRRASRSRSTSASRATAQSGRGRPRGSGKRAQQAERLLRSHPDGMTISELAGAMGVQPNYLYRVAAQLEADGKARKDGKTWYPVDGASSPS